MTAVASYAVNANLSAPFSSPLSTPTPPRLASEGDHGRTRPSSARVGHKRSLTPRASSSAGLPPSLRGHDDAGSASSPGTPATQPHGWLRRLSSNMSTSRDSSRAPASRPGSAVVSHSNGSFAFSTAGSTVPFFPETTSTPLPPNKLVKRASSVHSPNGSPAPLSASRLPLPVLRRPATSHQRSATLQEQLASFERNDRATTEASSTNGRVAEWSHYFVPRVASGEHNPAKRRTSTDIPKPIKRVYPDRRYTPTLVSAKEAIKPASTEFDDGLGDGAFSMEGTESPGVTSSPLPERTAELTDSPAPRRSFSIGDLLSAGPQPLWRRPSSSRGKTAVPKPIRRGRSRVASAPTDSIMGNASSSDASHDSERPSKRRDLTDPVASRRSIYSTSSSNHPTESPLPQDVPADADIPPASLQLTPDSHRAQEFSLTAPPQPSSPHELNHPPFPGSHSAPGNAARLSVTQSDDPSTVGSDSECRSVGDGSTDYQSDNVWDSFPTRTTRSSSGRRGPHIENIFDDSPPTFSSDRSSTKLRDFLQDGMASEHNTRYRHSTIEEEDSVISTPVRSIHNRSVASTPSARPRVEQVFSSSPPVVNLMPDPDDIDWDAPDPGPFPHGSGLGIQALDARTNGNHSPESLPFRFGPTLRFGASLSASSTPQRASASLMDRASLFDWSERQPSPSHADKSPPRPRTVHGKKEPDSRGGRSTGRRAPSTMHARSHSVPVVPDVDGKRNNVIANKFGTWGVGSKAVTEDWNEDFEFDEPSTSRSSRTETDERRVDSGHDMFVPRSIREQQHNVVANIGLLREWGLLIEELKELRRRAAGLDMLDGVYAQAWREVDAMIELADQESEEHTLEPRRTPPSSPGFDYGAFEEQAADGARLRQSSITRPDSAAGSSPDTFTTAGASPQTISSVTSRPRKDSELVAQSVIAALQSKRSAGADSATPLPSSSKKVPFDTATLRHIVPYVNGLKRKVKEALRETEGLYSSPRRRASPESGRRRGEAQDAPAFRSIFHEPAAGARGGDRRLSWQEMAATDNEEPLQPFPDTRGNLSTRMQNMNLPP